MSDFSELQRYCLQHLAPTLYDHVVGVNVQSEGLEPADHTVKLEALTKPKIESVDSIFKTASVEIQTRRENSTLPDVVFPADQEDAAGAMLASSVSCIGVVHAFEELMSGKQLLRDLSQLIRGDQSDDVCYCELNDSMDISDCVDRVTDQEKNNFIVPQTVGIKQQLESKMGDRCFILPSLNELLSSAWHKKKAMDLILSIQSKSSSEKLGSFLSSDSNVS